MLTFILIDSNLFKQQVAYLVHILKIISKKACTSFLYQNQVLIQHRFYVLLLVLLEVILLPFIILFKITAKHCRADFRTSINYAWCILYCLALRISSLLFIVAIKSVRMLEIQQPACYNASALSACWL